MGIHVAAQALASRGWFACKVGDTDFLDEAAHEAQAAAAMGRMSPGGVTTHNVSNENARSDKVVWLNALDGPEGEALRKVKALLCLLGQAFARPEVTGLELHQCTDGM